MNKTKHINSILLSVGSNMEDAEERVARAILWLHDNFHMKAIAGPYVTAPEGINAGDDDYVNAVVKLTTDLSVSELSKRLERYEAEEGREEGSEKIVIDLDVVMCNDEILRRDNFDSDYFRKGFSRLSN